MFIAPATIPGIDINADANITGITPAEFNLNGIYVSLVNTPPDLFEYCIVTLLSALSTKIIPIIIRKYSNINTTNNTIPHIFPNALLVMKLFYAPINVDGKLDTIPAIINSDIPLPTPLLVI